MIRDVAIVATVVKKLKQLHFLLNKLWNLLKRKGIKSQIDISNGDFKFLSINSIMTS